ncbi:hypothetical protein [Chitinilyticum litopenaei]|uniref:hypothetical protein n=1 Tax=Chitinilyticum litopenaei TaxID=1121276 RepID=UPI0003FE5FC8|nr:hypothetical protein [Chitinilyticum litopenaei]
MSTQRFRLTDTAHAQRYALNVPYTILENLAQPHLRGASRLFGAADLARLPENQRMQAAAYLGVFVVADGQGCITGIFRRSARLANPAQAAFLPAQSSCAAAQGWAQRQALARIFHEFGVGGGLKAA